MVSDEHKLVDDVYECKRTWETVDQAFEALIEDIAPASLMNPKMPKSLENVF